ncbi:YXWGXW repeat-containing protein [Paraburkholderia acidisoli]|uniref:BcpO-related WXXGXW repeat protein n=1 Tax=Paraburkholderia acidisoli TaxID=2571748 RepID=A0A7Z2GHV3_9BURK|nr:YXWGXW repeat-containing protein [Paraburkholderia acidisoli]QGZ62051.1 BcpO-related WXXGXW repeat protein [Paraburkholderia acidisoli]
MNNTLRGFIAKAAIVAAGTCAVAAPAFAAVVIVEPNVAPPAERVEVMPAPRAGYVWDKGHWQWARGHYVWVQGHWQHERVGYHWVPGHWVAHGPNWRWIEGHWAA